MRFRLVNLEKNISGISTSLLAISITRVELGTPLKISRCGHGDHKGILISNPTCLYDSHSGDVTDSIGRPTIFKTTSTDRPHFRHVEYLIANKILMGFAEIRNLVQF